MGDLTFRSARLDEADYLDEMTLKGVRSHGYENEFPGVVQGLAADLENHDISNSIVFVIEDGDEVIAFYELVDRDDHVELLRMFQRVDRIGSGLGRTIWEHCVSEAARQADRMLIVSDPGATGFYEHMGAIRENGFEPIPGFELGVYWYDLPSKP